MPKQAPPRTTRACKTCRSLKVRCLPSDQGEICQKCVRSGAECVFEELKPRRKRDKPDSRARVAALELKLEDLIAQVSQGNIEGQGANKSVAPSDSVSPSNSASPSDSKPSTHTPHSLLTTDLLSTPESQTQNEGYPDSCKYGNGDRACTSTLQQYLGDGATPETLISGGYLSTQDLEIYVNQFRGMCNYFPFVTIPRDVSIHSMLKDRPLLLHAALAVATSSDVQLQKVLEKSFKELMLRRLVIEAEKSVDLLQAILVCVAWGHFFHVPKRDQSYQLLQMAVGLCVDLGLNLTPSFAMQKRLGLHLDHYQPAGDVDEDRFWSREARRAYLGCYHVSTMNSWIWAKPNTAEYSEYMLQCAKSISEDPEYPTDELVLPLVQLQAIGDECHKTLRVARKETHSQSLLDRVGMQKRSFEKQIQDLKESLNPAAASSPAVQLALHFAAVHTYEQDLLSPFTSISRLMATGAPMDPMSSAISFPSRIDVLLDCLQAAVNYLDLFLTLPVTAYSLFGTSQWSGLIYSTVILYRLSIGTPRVPLWDVQVARKTVQLETYLEILCENVQQATCGRLKAIVGLHNRDLYSVMGLVLTNVRNTYERLRRLPQAQSQADDEPVHATSFTDEEAAADPPLPQPRPGPIFEHEMPRAGYQSRCPALQFWSPPQSDGTSIDGSILMADDPFLGVNMMDDDGFWSQAFADMAKTQEVSWTMDANMAGA